MSVLTQVGNIDVELSLQAVLTELPSPEVPESPPHDASVAKSANVAIKEKIFFTNNLHVIIEYIVSK